MAISVGFVMNEPSDYVSYLNAHHYDQGCWYDDGESLLVWDVWSVVPGDEAEGSVGDEEEEEGGAHPLQRTQEELSLVEQDIELSWTVQARVAVAVGFVHILGMKRVVVMRGVCVRWITLSGFPDTDLT